MQRWTEYLFFFNYLLKVNRFSMDTYLIIIG